MRPGGRNNRSGMRTFTARGGQFFGNPEEKFLSAAAQLEFVLEFNSYLLRRKDSRGFQKLREEGS